MESGRIYAKLSSWERIFDVGLEEALALIRSKNRRPVLKELGPHPETGAPRDVRYGDIAVLARTNDHVEAIAQALKAKRVPMKMTLRGLLEVPEICLARACLRRLTDSTDTDRLRAAAAGEAPWQWLEASHPIVGRLAELREDLKFQSPLETVVRVLNDVGIREIVCAWGPDALKAAQRQRNLDAFLDLVVEYEKYSASVHDAATLTGFLFWLMEPHSPDLDLQPTVTTGDAVHVLTYHKAKGLEWPVVIATDFNVDVQSDLWRVRVLPTAEFDIEAPLEHRAIRFWPRVFGDRRRGIAILDAIEASVEAQQSARAVAAEQRRLAYVGMTRARDLVVIALPESAPRASAWWQTFGDDTALPVADEVVLDDATRVPSRAVTLAAEAGATHVVVMARAHRATAQGRQSVAGTAARGRARRRRIRARPAHQRWWRRHESDRSRAARGDRRRARQSGA